MVDPSNKRVTEQIVATLRTGIGKRLITDRIPQKTIDTFREIQRAILNDFPADLGNANDPQVTTKNKRAAVDALLQQLQSTIDHKNSIKVQEV